MVVGPSRREAEDVDDRAEGGAGVGGAAYVQVEQGVLVGVERVADDVTRAVVETDVEERATLLAHHRDRATARMSREVNSRLRRR